MKRDCLIAYNADVAMPPCYDRCVKQVYLKQDVDAAIKEDDIERAELREELAEYRRIYGPLPKE